VIDCRGQRLMDRVSATVIQITRSFIRRWPHTQQGLCLYRVARCFWAVDFRSLVACKSRKIVIFVNSGDIDSVAVGAVDADQDLESRKRVETCLYILIPIPRHCMEPCNEGSDSRVVGYLCKPTLA